MFGISGEHLLILGIVLLIFGPRRLPELGNTLGKAIRNFKDGMNGVEEARFRRLDREAEESPQKASQQAGSPHPVYNPVHDAPGTAKAENPNSDRKPAGGSSSSQPS